MTGELEQLPRADRLRVKILAGSWDMLVKQLLDFPPALRERIGAPEPDTVRTWHAATLLLHASTINAVDEPPPERPKTVDDEPAEGPPTTETKTP